MNKGQEIVKTSFLDAQGQVTLWSVVGSGRISNSTKLLFKVIVNCKYEKDPIKKKLKKWQHLSLWGFFRRYGVGQLTPQSMVESRRISNYSNLLKKAIYY